MKKAKIILTAIAVFAIMGGALAYKVATFNPFQLWTISGTTIAGYLTTINGDQFVYTATVPRCTIIGRFADPDGPFFNTVRTSAVGVVKATVVGDTETMLISYRACLSFQTSYGTIQ